jgi:hypothetical protein
MQPELLCPRRSRFAPQMQTSFAAQSSPVKSSREGPLRKISRGKHSSKLKVEVVGKGVM